MDSTKLITKILSGIFRILAVVYLATLVYSAVCLLTGWGIVRYNDDTLIHINYPFTQIPFLNLDNNTGYQVFNFIFPSLLYGIFFLLTANVFKLFYQPKLFTQSNITRLKWFYYFNLIVPFIVSVICSVFTEVESIMWILVAVHFVLGVFAYLLATIFKKGLKLQNEQDLFI